MRLQQFVVLLDAETNLESYHSGLVRSEVIRNAELQQQRVLQHCCHTAVTSAVTTEEQRMGSNGEMEGYQRLSDRHVTAERIIHRSPRDGHEDGACSLFSNLLSQKISISIIWRYLGNPTEIRRGIE